MPGDAADLSNWVNRAGGSRADGGTDVEGDQVFISEVLFDRLSERSRVKGVVILGRGWDDAHVGDARHHAGLLD